MKIQSEAEGTSTIPPTFLGTSLTLSLVDGVYCTETRKEQAIATFLGGLFGKPPHPPPSVFVGAMNSAGLENLFHFSKRVQDRGEQVE